MNGGSQLPPCAASPRCSAGTRWCSLPAGRGVVARHGVSARHARGGIIAQVSRSSEHRDEARRCGRRRPRQDMIQNSGRLKGAVDQILADTVGVG